MFGSDGFSTAVLGATSQVAFPTQRFATTAAASPAVPRQLVDASYAPQERLKRRCDDVRSEVADDLVEGATQSRRVE